MRLDVIQLKEFYRGTELGRTTKHLINRVLEKLSVKVGNIQLAQYYKAEWLSCLRNAKRIKNQNKDGSSYNINQHEY